MYKTLIFNAKSQPLLRKFLSCVAIWQSVNHTWHIYGKLEGQFSCLNVMADQFNPAWTLRTVMNGKHISQPILSPEIPTRTLITWFIKEKPNRPCAIDFTLANISSHSEIIFESPWQNMLWNESRKLALNTLLYLVNKISLCNAYRW